MSSQSPDARCSEYSLGTGRLSLRIDRRLSSAPSELFRIAERQNPKRAFLFVSTLLGRHIPVAPSEHRKALSALADEVMPKVGSGHVLVMSYAETAIGLGMGIFEEISDRAPTAHSVSYLPTTRSQTRGASVWLETCEAHSHAVGHMVLDPEPGTIPSGEDTTLVLVDDETTTGDTFQDLAASLHRAGVSVDRVILVTLTDWSNGQADKVVAESMPGTKVSIVSLLSGQYTWSSFSGVPPRALPTHCPSTIPPWQPDLRFTMSVPRTGISKEKMTENQRVWSLLVDNLFIRGLEIGSRVLVIGTGEHVWHPFKAAEQIEQAGFEAGFISTTRSPVMKGETIEHQIAFPDHYGLGIWMYLNNVNPDDWDDIVLITETAAAGVPQSLRSALGKGSIMDREWIVVPMSDKTPAFSQITEENNA